MRPVTPPSIALERELGNRYGPPSVAVTGWSRPSSARDGSALTDVAIDDHELYVVTIDRLTQIRLCDAP